MKKRVKLVILLFYATGLLMFILRSVFKDKLGDFALGFYEGVSLVFIVLGTGYILYCAITKKNAFKL